MYNSINLEALKIASKNEVKPEIAGVLFTKDATIATDAFRLIKISTPKNGNIEEFPAKIKPLKEFKPFIIPADSLKAFKIAKTKNTRTIPLLENAVITEITPTTATLTSTDLDTINKKEFYTVDGEYPDWEQIMPTTEPIASFSINGEYLAELLTILTKLDPQTKEVKVKFYGKDMPIKLDCGNEQFQTGMAIIMPIHEKD
jgi:DNA polymerase III sliding clamp (beta) subunit (PCNA family)